MLRQEEQLCQGHLAFLQPSSCMRVTRQPAVPRNSTRQDTDRASPGAAVMMPLKMHSSANSKAGLLCLQG